MQQGNHLPRNLRGAKAIGIDRLRTRMTRGDPVGPQTFRTVIGKRLSQVILASHWLPILGFICGTRNRYARSQPGVPMPMLGTPPEFFASLGPILGCARPEPAGIFLFAHIFSIGKASEINQSRAA
jgi:hypothetical protein